MTAAAATWGGCHIIKANHGSSWNRTHGTAVGEARAPHLIFLLYQREISHRCVDCHRLCRCLCPCPSGCLHDATLRRLRGSEELRVHGRCGTRSGSRVRGKGSQYYRNNTILGHHILNCLQILTMQPKNVLVSFSSILTIFGFKLIIKISIRCLG